MNLIQDYMSQLNSNTFIYSNLLYIKYHENNQFLNHYEKEFLNNIIKDYEDKYGILNRNNIEVSQILNNEIILKEKFEENIILNKEKIEFPIKLLEEFHKFNLHYKRSGQKCAFTCNFKEILFLICKTNDHTLKLFLFNKYFNANRQHKISLVQLIKTRAVYANQIFFGESYAKFALMNNSMIRNFFSVTKLADLLVNEAFILKTVINKYFENKKKPDLIRLFELPLKKSLQQMQKDISIGESIEILVKIFEQLSFIKLEYYFQIIVNDPFTRGYS